MKAIPLTRGSVVFGTPRLAGIASDIAAALFSTHEWLGTATGANPDFYDILFPSGVDQRAALGDYDAGNGRLVAAPGHQVDLTDAAGKARNSLVEPPVPEC